MRIDASDLMHTPVVIALRSLLLFLIVTFIILSNTVNILILQKSHELQIFSRILFINLSAAGLVNGLFVCLPGFVASSINGWPFGKIYCHISSLLNGSSCTVTIWSLVAIGLDRYVAVHHVHFYRNTNKFLPALFTVVIFWILGIFIFSYPLIRNGSLYEFHVNLLICSFVRHSNIFNIITTVLIYILSTLILCLSSYKIVRTLRNTNQMNARLQRRLSNARTTNAVNIIILSLICFLGSWGPYVISDILVSFNIIKTIPPSMDFVITWLANSNSFMTVLIYSGNSIEFRSHLKSCLQNCFTEKPRMNTRKLSSQSQTRATSF